MITLNRTSRDLLLVLLILTVQNIAIYFGHYFMHHVFPWDFAQGYYAFTAFWTTAVDQGLFPQWIPFQSMGYPLAMNLQSGMYYPPLWLFPAFGIPYTLTAAVVVQCLHVLFGSIGMFFFLRVKLGSQMLALTGAIMFQFFGGFYSNAEHVDIIRAFAITPWLFHAFSFQLVRPVSSLSLRTAIAAIEVRNLLIPIFVYLMAVGGYPGNFVSSLFVLAVYVLLQMAKSCLHLKSAAQSFSTAVSALLLTLLGLAMAFVHLGPAWLEKGSLTREHTSASIAKMGLWFEHLPTLFLSNSSLPGEISMTSCYITLPAAVLLAFLPFEKVKEFWMESALLVLALLMVAGPKSPVFTSIVKALPPLNYSRFPSSDYRIFIGIFLILLGMAALKSVSENILSLPLFTAKALVSAILLFVGYVYFQKIDPLLSFPSLPFAALLTIAGLTLVALYWGGNKKVPVTFMYAVVALLALADGVRVIPLLELHRGGAVVSTWRDKDSYFGYKAYGHRTTGGKLPVYDILGNPPSSRPSRIDSQSARGFSWAGYLTGNYLASDSGGTKLTTLQKIENNPDLNHYMLLPWVPILFRPDYGNGTGTEAPLLANESIRQTRYGLDAVQYRVRLNSPRFMIENETYFNGWKATLTGGAINSEISAISFQEGVRGWQLPAGEYTMEARFQFPHLKIYRSISVVAFLAWATGIWAFIRKRDSNNSDVSRKVE